jgi:hypothetical protein
MPSTDLTRVIERVLVEWDEPGGMAVLPAEHELALLIERAVLAHFLSLSDGQRSDLILGLSVRCSCQQARCVCGPPYEDADQRLGGNDTRDEHGNNRATTWED